MFICAGICGSAGKLQQKYNRCLQDIGKDIFLLSACFWQTRRVSLPQIKKDYGKQQTEPLRMAGRCDQKTSVHNIDRHQRQMAEEFA